MIRMAYERNLSGAACSVRSRTPPLGSRCVAEDRKACRHGTQSRMFMIRLRKSRNWAAFFIGLVNKSAGFSLVG